MSDHEVFPSRGTRRPLTRKETGGGRTKDDAEGCVRTVLEATP
jgi:hypothetical protein